MFPQFFRNENSKIEEGIKSLSALDSILPRLFPKENNKIINNDIPISTNSFLSKKRNKSISHSSDSSLEESKHINLYKILNQMHNKNLFIDQQQENINNYKKFHFSHTTKCYICGKSGHHGAECKEKNEEICEKCLQKNHGDKDCPKEICFICGKRGHKSQNCYYKKKSFIKNNKIIKRCVNCHNNGHDSNDCLCRPNPVYIKNYAKKPLCYFCGSSKHYLCPSRNDNLYLISDYKESRSDNYFNYYENNNNENYILNRNSFDSLLNFFMNESKKSEKIELYLGKISDNITKEEIKKINFCCKCGNTHFSKDCKKNKNKSNIISNDNFIFNLKENIIHSRNPLKFEPYEKKEYKINHHDLRSDYYDEQDSSGESFNEIFNKKSKDEVVKQN